jgi:asparagine synthase (glutamine-hydrolysing)
MCGITGLVRFEESIPAKFLRDMTDVIRHRGPDDEGFYCITDDNRELILSGQDTKTGSEKLKYLPQQAIIDQADTHIKFGFGHRRLSVVDLSPFGHQPFCIDDGNYWICYNGEVYNHIELRQELEQIGHVFRSHSDTEVVLAAYKQWGNQCLNKFNGMFAFLIYDKVQQQLFIARDRFGVKPLYYYQDADGIYFASEIKQFTLLPNWQAHLNHQRAYDFLAYGLTDHTEDTLFADVKQIRGGECSIIDLANLQQLKNQGLTKQRWYHLTNKVSHKDYVSACNEFRDVFTDAVRLRLRSDIPVGSCLSGGLDSSAIVSVMAKLLEGQQSKQDLLTTFSACSHHKQFDEKEYIDEVVEQTKSNAHYCYPELDNLLNSMEQITWHQDEPFGSTSIYAQWTVFEEARQNHVTVMLDGQGADEQLAGYQELYFQIYLNQLIRHGKLIQFIRELRNFSKIHSFNKIQGTLKAVLSLCPIEVKQYIGKLMGKQRYELDWLNKQYLKFNQADPFLLSGQSVNNVKQTLYGQIMHNNLPMLLHWEDRDSMAHSVESRVPFLDYRLVELIYGMPTSYKIKDGVTKLILRDSLSGILPNKIRDRMSKLGFVTSEEIWVKSHIDLFRQKLIEAIQASHGILAEERTLEIFNNIISGRQKFDFWLWRVINFGQWIKTFNVKL